MFKNSPVRIKDDLWYFVQKRFLSRVFWILILIRISADFEVYEQLQIFFYFDFIILGEGG
jgi:hypothetical protein